MSNEFKFVDTLEIVRGDRCFQIAEVTLDTNEIVIHLNRFSRRRDVVMLIDFLERAVGDER